MKKQNMKYETPSVDVLSLTCENIIAVSGSHEGFGTSSIDGATEIGSDGVMDMLNNLSL